MKRKGISGIVLEKYSPRMVEDITGLKRKAIIEVARKFALAEAPIALAGRGRGYLPGSLYEFMAVHALNALVGRVNKKGGALITNDIPLAKWPDREYDPVALDCLK